MEILNRAKGNSSEIIPFGISQSDIQDEVNRRTSKAGYTNRNGEPSGRTKIMIASPTEQYRKNYDRIKWSR